MSAELTIAIVSAGVAVVATSITVWAQFRQSSREYQRSKQDELDAVITRYSEPLIAAAFELQSRLYNIVRQNFLAFLRSDVASEREYARGSTLWLIGTYLGWVELLRRDLEHLNLGDIELTKALQARLFAIRHTLRRDDLPRPLRIFHAHQRAIGEVMIADGPGTEGGRCLGYAAFRERLGDEMFAGWFTELAADIEALAAERPASPERLRLLQGQLVALLDLLDPDYQRYPAADRQALAPTG